MFNYAHLYVAFAPSPDYVRAYRQAAYAFEEELNMRTINILNSLQTQRPTRMRASEHKDISLPRSLGLSYHRGAQQLLCLRR